MSTPGTVPTAPVAPGSVNYNLLCGPGIAGILVSDYDRTGVVEETDAEYIRRIVRPGAILLANLNVSDPTRLPAHPADRRPVIDSQDAIINGSADEADLTLLKVRKPSPCNAGSSRVLISVAVEDASRIRIFQIGAGPDPILGARTGGPLAETPLPSRTTTPWAFDYRIEALTLAGDPTRRAPSASAPARPDPYPADPAGGPNPICAARAPGEVWIEITGQTSSGAAVATPRDTALFTIAPFVLISNLQPARRLYAVYLKHQNHNFIYDIAEACVGIFGAAVTLPADTSTPFTPHTPASSAPFYIIDGALYRDEWVQDELEIGYCWAPHAWMHVVLHCKRNRALGNFIHQELPALDMGLFDSLEGAPRDSPDFGGNLEVSPPVSVATPAIPSSDHAGPSVPAHTRPAPFGKILLGDCTPRPVHDEYRAFLLAQNVQPILPLDTSWLTVGHVDEFLCFVPSSAGQPYRLLLASIRTMRLILEQVSAIPVARGRTNFHCGKWAGGRDPGSPFGPDYDEISAERLLSGPAGRFNTALRTDKLVPIQRRLETGLHLTPPCDFIVPIPIYFEEPAVSGSSSGTSGTLTVAKTVGMVNMQVVGTHVLVPRPFGPRMHASDAGTVLRNVLAHIDVPGATVTLPSATGYWFWAYPTEDIDRFASYFARPTTAAGRNNIIDNISTGAALSAANTALVDAMKTAILADPNNTGMPATGAFPDWRRVWIPDDTVDVMEAYMLSVLQPLGLTVHFIDDWFYHIGDGEVHCGTNVRRDPPELTSAARWWDSYDPDYNTQYDPAA